LFLGHPLHAKLYLLFRPDPINPIVGYLGSSNLTFSGLRHQGELNIDVLDLDACKKLAKWFEDRWNDRWCLDISNELVEIIETSWARLDPVPPYHIYLKLAYHLSQEARAGLTEFAIPRDFGAKLFEFQKAAVKIAAHHLNKRGGVLIGDVVGLGKTLMATAVARIMEDDHGLETLVICPKNLVPMWEDYRQQYRLRAKVLSLSQVTRELPKLRRYRLILIDESHNLRNREGKRFRAIQQYVEENESKCILLSATPYNKTYLDLSNQLRLFVKEDRDLGIRPEQLLKELGSETGFLKKHQCPVRSLAAFEFSPHADDWRDLMRLYLVRRTRSFIQQNYAATDPDTGRKFLTFEDGTRSYFPARQPKTVKFRIGKGGTGVPPVDHGRDGHATDIPGVLVYMKTPEGNDALAWMNDRGESVTESQYQILRMAECPPDTPAVPRQPNHHDLVRQAVELIVTEEKTVGGQLGRPSGARFRTYERLKRYEGEVKGTLFESPELVKVIEEVYRYPLRQTAVDTLNRQLRSGISDQDLASLAIALRQEERLCLIHEDEQAQEPRIICSLGLAEKKPGK